MLRGLPKIPRLPWWCRFPWGRRTGIAAKTTILPPCCPPICTPRCQLFNDGASRLACSAGPGSGARLENHGPDGPGNVGRLPIGGTADGGSARDVHRSGLSEKSLAIGLRTRRLFPSSSEGGARDERSFGCWQLAIGRAASCRTRRWLESRCSKSRCSGEREPQANARPCGVRRWQPASEFGTSANPWPPRPVGCR